MAAPAPARRDPHRVGWSEITVAVLAQCPGDAMPWAAAGYRAGWEDGIATTGYGEGYDAAEGHMADAWRSVAQRVRAQAHLPSFRELQTLRTETEPARCSVGCMRCSACIRWEVWTARGGRDFLGVDAELALAKRGAAS